jgi:hypothetical protein
MFWISYAARVAGFFFRIVVLAGAILALLSSLSAWLMIRKV